jgi:hypothetical protein
LHSGTERGIINGEDMVMPKYIIRKVRMAHCKLGPERCETCRELDAGRISLLEIDPPGTMQRRVIQVHEGGSWHEFDVVQVFADEDEARAYADEHGIEDVAW